jgi:hypothetical protein
MRAFLTACLAIVVIGAGGYFLLNSIQQPSGLAYATDGARINPKWSWRSIDIPGAPSDMAEACNMRAPSQWIFVDFGTPHGESKICSDSQ